MGPRMMNFTMKRLDLTFINEVESIKEIYTI